MIADQYTCFFFNDTATTEIYTLSLHDALPIFWIPTSLPGSKLMVVVIKRKRIGCCGMPCFISRKKRASDRKSTRLNSSHPSISYAVFCLKKKIKSGFMLNDDAAPRISFIVRVV